MAPLELLQLVLERVVLRVGDLGCVVEVVPVARRLDEAAKLGDPSRGIFRPSAHAVAFSGRRGRRMRNVVPRLTSLSTWMRPPCASTMSRAIARPRPAPPARFAQDG